MSIAESDFREIWMVDFEFVAPDGDLQTPVCMVARELFSGQLLRLRREELLALDQSPIGTGPDVLFCAYYASAELKCYIQLGWDLPERVFDFLVEWKWLTNGAYCSLIAQYGYSLPYCLASNHIRSITAAEKKDMRDLIMAGGPWTDSEMDAIVDYCQSDVDPLVELWKVWRGKIHLPSALMRGRYTIAVAKMETTGVPIDMEMLELLRENWDDVRAALIATDQFGLFDENNTFKHDRFRKLVVDNQWFWPTTEEGQFKTDEGTMKAMANRYPVLMPLYELRRTLSEMKLNKLAVGRDGRNRCLLGPFGSKTGRNQPSNSKFIYGTARWLRHLVKPSEGRAIAYVDWSQQELGIAAALSGDSNMLTAYQSGDPYLEFGKLLGAIPKHATKESHPHERGLYKVVMLGVQFGMSEFGLAPRLGCMKMAKHLLMNHREIFRDYWTWSQEQVNYSIAIGKYFLRDGWVFRSHPETRKRTYANFPIQGHGASMMRQAACLLTEAGVNVCCPVHDAFLIEAGVDEIDDVVNLTQRLMGDASEDLLKNLRLQSDAEIVKFPDRYVPESGHELWETATRR
jgi:DNA polymerase I-like protein with 3'-5' exonuclease and polymerase domains